MRIEIPELSLVVLIGASGSGKSTFAARHFRPTEVLSSDFFRGLVSDDENDLSATADAFAVLHDLAGRRLRRGRLTVVDATNVRPEDRRHFVQIAREHHCLVVAIVLDLSERICRDRNTLRPDRNFGPNVIRNQRSSLRRSLGRNGGLLRREGFHQVWMLQSPQDVDAVEVARTPLWNNRRSETGPFDIIGDVHGCFDELIALLETLGYGVHRTEGVLEGDWEVTPPRVAISEVRRGVALVDAAWNNLRNTEGRAGDDDEPAGGESDAAAVAVGGPAVEAAGADADSDVPRRLIFLGDLVDRGPKSPAVLRLVMRLVAEGKALCVPGNHDVKLMRKLNGRAVQITHGLAETLAQFEGETPAFVDRVANFIDSLVSHYVFDDGRLVVAHAGLKESMQGRGSRAVREFCLYGETTGETDEFGLPVRFNWAAEYRGRALVVYGHTPVGEPQWLNNTVCIDTGCVYGGRLTALRYPEGESVSVAAREVYAHSARPFPIADQAAAALSLQQRHDDMLDLADVIGKRIIETRLQRQVTIREENAVAALETMSRFAADPRWLIYLPPTMSPCETSELPGLLEHPAEALDYYRSHGVAEVICEEKHMGSRAVAVVCRDEAAARSRFGIAGEDAGIVYTRTGRRFFDGPALERGLIDRLRVAMDEAGLWEELATSWVCLDCELLPWSAKAQGLLRDQYAAVGSAAEHGLAAARTALATAAERLRDEADIEALATRFAQRAEAVGRFRAAYRGYCWPVTSLEDLQLAPFHLLASEGAVHVQRRHDWHMRLLARLAERDPLFVATRHQIASVIDEPSRAAAISWWEQLTDAGGEGMVVKPLDFIARGRRGLLQPAVKCRGPEYLRIIYGPEYLAPEHLSRLRRRGLRHKRSLALQEFALGIEGLERFVRGEPLRRVHECVFAVLALESEPVDPRL